MDTMTETAWIQGTRLAVAGVSFVPADLLGRIDAMTDAELDELPFAAARVDDDGVVLAANAAHDRFLGADAQGRHWFFHVAPCTDNRLFRGVFRRGVAQNRMDVYFMYAFTFRMAPTDTRVHLHRAPGGANWIFCLPS